LLCCVTVAAGVVPDSEGAGASLRDVLAAALDANREMARLAAVLREENARLRAEGAEQAAELERVRADLAVLQRMVFGRSSERARPEPSADGGDAGQGRNLRGSGTGGKKRGPVARAGRRDYSHLPRVEVAWDFGAAGTAARSAGRRSRAWAAITWRSSWTGW
jgi:transposase